MAITKGIIKTWSNENWLAYIDMLLAGSNSEQSSEQSQPFEARIVLAGGPDDKEVIAELEAALKAKGVRYISAAGKTKGLADLAALTSLCDLLVCVDSAPMHIGVGLNKKLIALFGPTEPHKLIPDEANFRVLADRPASPAPPRTLLDGLGVRLHPESVYQSSLDLLKAD